MNAPRPSLSDERGVTLTELLVGMSIGIVVLLALFALIETVGRSGARTVDRVAVNQVARPALQGIIDELHSSCITPGLAPVQAGSTGESIAFIHQTGSAANLTATKRVISLAAGTLGSATHPTTGGAAPDWTFATTPSSTYRLLERVSQAKVGSPPATVPIFRYYAYLNGSISPTPLQTPLVAADAVRVVQVSVSFAATPFTTDGGADPNAAINLSGSALLRFSPSNEDTTQAGLPCT